MALTRDLGLRGDLFAHQAQLCRARPMRSFKGRLLNAHVLGTAPRVTCVLFSFGCDLCSSTVRASLRKTIGAPS